VPRKNRGTGRSTAEACYIKNRPHLDPSKKKKRKEVGSKKLKERPSKYKRGILFSRHTAWSQSILGACRPFRDGLP